MTIKNVHISVLAMPFGTPLLPYPDFDDAFAHGLQQADIIKVMEANRVELNQQLPNYSQISKVKIHFEEFEKTAKKSIKRFMYQEAKG